MTLDKRILALKVLAVLLLIGPGLLMVTAPVTGLGSWVEAFLDLAHQPWDGGQSIAEGGAPLLNAILGGILVGFGVMIWQVAGKLLQVNEPLGRSIILTALLCWFVTDSLGSVLAGAWFNAVINLAILISLLIPLLWRKEA